MSNIDHMIEVMTAYKNGATIQHRYRNTDEQWTDITQPTWDWYSIAYRVKPIPREFTIIHHKVSGNLSVVHKVNGQYQYDPDTWEMIKVKEEI